MSAKDTMENKITEGVIWKQLLLFFFPILVGTFFQQLYNTVDAVIVGRFVGKEALSCVSGSSGQIINLVVGFFTGLSAGATVMISQHFGAKNEEQLHKALHTAYAFAITGGIIAGVIGVVMTRMVLKWMNTPENLRLTRHFMCGFILRDSYLFLFTIWERQSYGQSAIRNVRFIF